MKLFIIGAILVSVMILRGNAPEQVICICDPIFEDNVYCIVVSQ
jgi:hypothetical protein